MESAPCKHMLQLTEEIMCGFSVDHERFVIDPVGDRVGPSGAAIKKHYRDAKA